MSLITVNDPNYDRLERRLNQVFDHFFNDLGWSRKASQESSSGITPAIDISETDKNWVVHAELPGVNKEEIKLEYHGNAMVISGESRRSKDYEKENVRYQERRYGSFSRSVPLPENVDKTKINAKFENGLLEVLIPKSEESTPRKIEIS
ncbi:hypothetical protein NQZ79_g3032 [Umbelopsis isabellina]|nr:hypothetical protein NQZ79_g3032 [Umbelopsis isabellina]